jgi:hypothetical protein
MLFATAWMLAGLVHAWWWLVPAGFGTALGGFLIDMYEKSDS